MAIDFPASPSLNDTFSSGGVTYTWDGTVWAASGSAAFLVAGEGIDALGDVDTSTVAPTDGQSLVWDNTAGQWEPGTVVSSQWDDATGGINYAGGNIGIGVTSPGRRLHVSSSQSVVARLESTGTTLGGIDLKDANTTADFKVKLAAVGDELRLDAGGNERMRIASGGNVGIGTDSPSEKLHISGTNAKILLDSTANSNSGEISFTGKDSSGNSFETFKLNTSYTGAVTISTDPDNSAFSTASDIKFEQSGTEKMRIDSSGNVGIGTSSPADHLHIENSTSNMIRCTNTQSFGQSDISLIGSRDTLGITGQVKFFNHRNASDPNTGAEIFASIDGISRTSDVTSTNKGGDLAFATRGTASSASLTERMRIRASGNVGIGTSTPGSTLEVNGSLSKNSGSFKIDHPLPALTETHHLVHSFVEAPDASNLYAGMVDLVDGTATVNIDTAHRMTEGTFEALNTIQSWSSSNESGYAPVKCSISGNLLTIECQDPTSTDTVYYEVRGIRKDQHMIDTEWTDENGRVITEPLKAPQQPTEES